MFTEGRCEVWTGQTSQVLDTIKKEQRYVVKRAYVDQKYKETAWSFQEAYRYLAEAVKERLPRPADAESPVWVYRDAGYIGAGADIHYMKLEVLVEDILFFDLRKWNRILNLSYIGESEEEERQFEKWLKSSGKYICVMMNSSAF